jgi:hypothetical protein
MKNINLEYGIIKTLDNDVDVWFESITDDLDGFVIRDKDGFILKLFLERVDKSAYDKFGNLKTMYYKHDKR